MLRRPLKLLSTIHKPQIPSPCLTQLAISLHTKLANDEDVEEEEEEWSGGGRFQLHKSRGQHILTNPRVLDTIVGRAEVLPTDTVLEIGPGTGNLTVRLLRSARSVVSVEIDTRMVDVLGRRVEKLGLQDRLTTREAREELEEGEGGQIKNTIRVCCDELMRAKLLPTDTVLEIGLDPLISPQGFFGLR